MKRLISISICLNAFFGFTQKDSIKIVDMDECIDINETQSSFPGGIYAFHHWFSEEVLKVNTLTQFDKIKGTAQFVVNNDGNVIDVKISEINYPEVSKSIIKILENSPKWNPTAIIAGDAPPQFYKQHIELPFEIRK